jgi:hypothetical protein
VPRFKTRTTSCVWCVCVRVCGVCVCVRACVTQQVAGWGKNVALSLFEHQAAMYAGASSAKKAARNF